ncbi:MAG: hypothetical protein JWN98_899 [Abditibacteriota bacterium]|nr:hypothetical protein [Abditibacteriota bacterium]
MKSWISGIIGAATVCALMSTMPSTMSSAEAAPAPKGAKKATAKKTMAKKPAKKLVAVRICPISSDVVDGEGAGTRIVRNYKAYFC